MSSRVLGLLALAVACTVAAPARAEKDAAGAQFDIGLAEMQAGRYATGCPALAASYRLDPRPGVLFTLAECEAKWGRLASALAHYDIYLGLFAQLNAEEQGKQRERERVATAKRAALLPQVPELTVVLPTPIPAGTIVKRDDVVITSINSPFRLDAGEHIVTVQTPDAKVQEQRVSLGAGEKRRLVFSTEPETAPATQASAPEAKVTPRGIPRRTWVYVAGGIGIAGVAVGTITGIITLGRNSTIGSHCGQNGLPANLCDTPSNTDEANGAKTFGWVSTVAFGIGIGGLATAAVLYFTGPSKAGSGASAAQSDRDRSPWRPLVARAGADGALLGVQRTW